MTHPMKHVHFAVMCGTLLSGLGSASIASAAGPQGVARSYYGAESWAGVSDWYAGYRLGSDPLLTDGEEFARPVREVRRMLRATPDPVQPPGRARGVYHPYDEDLRASSIGDADYYANTNDPYEDNPYDDDLFEGPENLVEDDLAEDDLNERGIVESERLGNRLRRQDLAAGALDDDPYEDSALEDDILEDRVLEDDWDHDALTPWDDDLNTDRRETRLKPLVNPVVPPALVPPTTDSPTTPGTRPSAAIPTASSEQWSYDYDDGYLRFDDWDNDGIYEVAHQYYDIDIDGLYDAYTVSFDLDEDGAFDRRESFAFNQAGEGSAPPTRNLTVASSVQKQARGRVRRIENVDLPDAWHVVVELRRPGRSPVLVDLGPVASMGALRVHLGDDISAAGPIAEIGARPMIVARRINSEGWSMQIHRKTRATHGEIVATRTTRVNRVPHRMAIVESNDERRLADLGPEENLAALNLQPGQPITIVGPRVKVQNDVLLMARKVEQDGHEMFVDRSTPPDYGQSRTQQRSSSSKPAADPISEWR